jgi:hypothetical protein
MALAGLAMAGLLQFRLTRLRAFAVNLAIRPLGSVLAVLLATGGYAHAQPRAEPPAEILAAQDCRTVYRGIANDRRRHPNRALVSEGISTFFGYCHRPDRARGLAMTERGVRTGFGEVAAIVGEMYEILGDAARAAEWYELAAMTMLLSESLSTPPISVVYRPPAAEAALARLQAALRAPDAARLVEMLERLDARAPIFAAAEGYFWNEAAEMLRRAGRSDGLYWLARLYFTRGGMPDFVIVKTIEQASICGEPRAVREHAERYLADRAPFGDPRRIAEAVARLHQTTRSDGDLLARVERRLGHAAYASPDAVRQGIKRAAAECRFILPAAR